MVVLVVLMLVLVVNSQLFEMSLRGGYLTKLMVGGDGFAGSVGVGGG